MMIDLFYFDFICFLIGTITIVFLNEPNSKSTFRDKEVNSLLSRLFLLAELGQGNLKVAGLSDRCIVAWVKVFKKRKI